MPGKNKSKDSKEKCKKTSAEELIARCTTHNTPDQDTMDELGKIIIHNENNPQSRVSAEKTLEWLCSRGFRLSRTRLDRICKECLGRKSFTGSG